MAAETRLKERRAAARQLLETIGNLEAAMGPMEARPRKSKDA